MSAKFIFSISFILCGYHEWSGYLGRLFNLILSRILLRLTCLMNKKIIIKEKHSITCVDVLCGGGDVPVDVVSFFFNATGFSSLGGDGPHAVDIFTGYLLS